MASAPPRVPARLDEVIEGALTGTLAPREAPDEAAFDAIWREYGLSAAEPALMAAVGGALADRLAWVFLSGYQATLRRACPDLPIEAGWSALVNTEGVDGLPGTVLEGAPGARRLSGWKTWLAAAGHVERLLVSARHNELPLIVIRRDTPGVVIEHSRAGGYLGEMVQGRVHFDGVAVSEEQLITDPRAFPTFRASESAYVRVALAAFVLAHTVRLRASAELIMNAASALLAAAGAIALPLPSRAAAVAAGGVEAQARALIEAFEPFVRTADPALGERLARDARLYRADTLARRAADELAALGLALPRPSSA
jgi:alkylation response protein AidB-like acyl-CoA dehydrogenase